MRASLKRAGRVLDEVEAGSAGAAARCKGIVSGVSSALACFRDLYRAGRLLLALPFRTAGYFNLSPLISSLATASEPLFLGDEGAAASEAGDLVVQQQLWPKTQHAALLKATWRLAGAPSGSCWGRRRLGDLLEHSSRQRSTKGVK